MRPPILLITALMSSATFAGELPGKALHDKSCIACHARMYGGDGTRMYTREGRMVANQTELQQRVATCSSMTKAGWTPDEEAAVAAWLNQRFYHFGP